MQKITIKPLSVNKAWMGKRRKTSEYNLYCLELSAILPDLDIDFSKGQFGINIIWYLKNHKRSDTDNPTKPFIDILSEHYGFNDNILYDINLKKRPLIDSENDYIEFEFFKLDVINK